MRRLSTPAICAAILCMAMAGSAHASVSAYHTGPHWWYKTKELTSTSETLATRFVGGITKWKSAIGTIECTKASGKGQIEGGSPGTGNATIKFEGCKVLSLGCEVRNKGGTMGTIEIKSGVELVYLTKAAIEGEVAPLGLLFKTLGAGEKKFVELEFSSLCSLENGPIEATGEERTAGTPGVAGVMCKLVEKIEAQEALHSIECIEGQQKTFWGWINKSIAEGKAGLAFKGTTSEELMGKGEVELESKEPYAASGSSFPGWFTKGVEIGTPTVPAILKSGVTVITVPGRPLPITLQCEKDTGYITLEPIGWATKGDITLENCKVVQDASCLVVSILIKFANQLVFIAGTKKADVAGLFEVENAPIEINKCTREGKYLLQGMVAGESSPMEVESKAVDEVFRVSSGAQGISEVEEAFHLTFVKPKLELYSEAEKKAYPATFEGTEEEELESKESIELRR